MKKTRLSQKRNFKSLTVSKQDKYDIEPVELYSSEAAEDGYYKRKITSEQARNVFCFCIEDDEVYEVIDYFSESFLWEYYRKIAIIRFFEIWGDLPRKKEKIINGMGIDKNKEASISGMISNLLQLGIIIKGKDGNLVYLQRPEDYALKNHFKTLIPDAVRICKEQARTYRERSKEK